MVNYFQKQYSKVSEAAFLHKIEKFKIGLNVVEGPIEIIQIILFCLDLGFLSSFYTHAKEYHFCKPISNHFRVTKKLEKIEVTEIEKIYINRERKIKDPGEPPLTHSFLVVRTHFDYGRKID